MHIAVFDINHLDGILDIESNSFPLDAYSETEFVFLFKEHPDTFLVAKFKDDLAGYIVAAMNNQIEGCIVSMAVSPQFRSRGVAKLLFNAVKDRLELKGAKSLVLHVRTTNEIAIRLYLKLGFRTEAVVPMYYEDKASAWLMRLVL